MELIHHGGHLGVTGSCHQIRGDAGTSLLVDCGIFQGEDARRHRDLQIEFPLDGVLGLVLTHVHIDHAGRLPYLLAAGFEGPIYCTHPTAQLLPLVMEDALKIGFTRDRRLIRAFLDKVRHQVVALDYDRWHDIESFGRMRMQVAGHILGSAWIELETSGQRIVFSGDLGAPHAPLLKDAASPESADLLVMESTYGDKLHDARETRQQRLEKVLRKTLENKGVTIIPAFSLGRTQELLFEMNLIFERIQKEQGRSLMKAVDVLVDSPLASRFTDVYAEMQPFWDAEAKQVLTYDTQPLVFDNLFDVGDHEEHQDTLNYLRSSGIPAVVIAGSGMCTGGRVVNYLKAFLGERNTDVVFVGYQGSGTPGRAIQGGRRSVEFDDQVIDIQAEVHNLAGYSAHADQQDLMNFVEGMAQAPGEIVLVHGEETARHTLARELRKRGHHVR